MGVQMKSTVIKRSVVIGGRKTSISVEDAFWKAVREIASERQLTTSGLVERIRMDRNEGNLSSAIRQFVLAVYQDRIAHRRERSAA